MAAYLCRLNHIALHVLNGGKTVHDLVTKFKFNLFAARLTEKSRQLALRKGSAVFIVNERLNQPSEGGKTNGQTRSVLPQRGAKEKTRVFTLDHGSIRNQTRSEFLYDVQPSYVVDTACNVCFEVEDVESSNRRLSEQGCDVLVPPTVVEDDQGFVTYAVVKSVVGNVCHTLIDRSKYEGQFLPGFQGVQNSSPVDGHDSKITHFDHITYACPRRSSVEIIRWYEKHFGFHSFFINRNEDAEEGYVLDQNGIGLRLRGMQYWKCSRAGMKPSSTDMKEPDCKFVLAESLPQQGRNQVDSFLEQHSGPGILHVGLYTQDIVSTAHTLAKAGVHFFSPPPAYYSEVEKQQEIVDAGYDPQLLSHYGILLDTELCEDLSDPKSLCQDTSNKNKRYLLQVFTKPIFAEDTFYLELIERKGASGFGEGNIRALWRSMQTYIDSEGRGEQEKNPGPVPVQN
ncbi:HPDL protein, partial [Atractosteus spatula]|nr:HPDL protein [Atractosteus spatula]